MRNFFIASNSSVFTKGLVGLLENKHRVIGTSEDSFEALRLIKNLKPAIAILDLNNHAYLSNIKIAIECRKLNNLTKIIIFSSSPVIDFEANTKKTNIQGYLLKESSIESIEECIDSVCNNLPYIAPGINVLNFNDDYLKKLTKAEFKILQLISNKKKSTEIADKYGLSRRTVEKHRSNIIKKLNLSKENYSLSFWAIKYSHFMK